MGSFLKSKYFDGKIREIAIKSKKFKKNSKNYLKNSGIFFIGQKIHIYIKTFKINPKNPK
jgi:hypothetical protein